MQKSDPLNREQHVRRLETLADWLDSRFRVPGTSIRFGLDALLGLVPGIGDGLTTIPAIYLVVHAAYLGVPRPLLLRMTSNIGLDLLIGAVPLVGDVFDFGFKANRRNIQLMRTHIERENHLLRGG